ncbi:quinone oxidoreductase PIG3 [Rosa chinensis]|uniref:quinone oxidoreductase PIG3 n=1 Tax=Rosa chinensis TaxID=74649 RepID=UPI000D093AB7|nr:quinone oxidoreductase PIG3 [Rosa chinensis]
MLRKLGCGGRSSTESSLSSSGPKKELLMRALVATSEGGEDEVLQVQLVPRPVPKAKEVLIKVAYAGVNRADVEETNLGEPTLNELEKAGLKGKYMGVECSGTVCAHGEMSKKDKQTWKIDTKVCAILVGGAYAEYVAAPIGHLLKFTTKIPVELAAAIPQDACTVWSELFMKKRLYEGSAPEEEGEGSRLSSGETVLIHEGCSGIGIFAIQMAKYQGATAFATAGTNAKIAECRRLGADLCINYNKNDFVEVIKDRTKGQGVDVILDCVGCNGLHRNLECLKKGGRLVHICDNGRWMKKIDAYTELSNYKLIDVASLLYRTPEMKTVIVKEVQEKVMPAIENGDVKLVIHNQVFTFEEAAEAHKLKKSNLIGKILLHP